MKGKKMTIVWTLSLLIVSVTSLFVAGANAAWIDLTDILVRVLGIVDLLALSVFAFISVKRFFSH